MKKETLKQHAYNIIKDKIINCEYAPSALLNEEMLKEDVQASRTPIRDALGRLEQEGLVTILPKKGIMVAPLTIREINMVHEARTLIDLLQSCIMEIKFQMKSTRIISASFNVTLRMFPILTSIMRQTNNSTKCSSMQPAMTI